MTDSYTSVPNPREDRLIHSTDYITGLILDAYEELCSDPMDSSYTAMYRRVHQILEDNLGLLI